MGMRRSSLRLLLRRRLRSDEDGIGCPQIFIVGIFRCPMGTRRTDSIQADSMVKYRSHSCTFFAALRRSHRDASSPVVADIPAHRICTLGQFTCMILAHLRHMTYTLARQMYIKFLSRCCNSNPINPDDGGLDALQSVYIGPILLLVYWSRKHLVR
jgi:hypothetical protein